MRKRAFREGKEVKKVSVLFPVDLLRKIQMVASLRQENMSQAIVRLTAQALRQEMGSGEADLELLDKLVGSVPAGGDAVEDSREAF
ncbi:MAG: hypothetical protein DRH24_12045 [Deltaproteobacteria bacterium]|nr:MAG: hypothetical protein DRH24_12045 [Deltaproteobacteria bacterium]